MTRIVRYAVVGLLSNAAGYLLYLLITWLGIGPKTAMTGLYVAGASLGFIGNRQWTFSSRASLSSSLVRYGIAQFLGYGINFFLLYFFVDQLGFPHQLVQGIAVFVVALFLYTTFKHFVFPEKARRAEGGQ